MDSSPREAARDAGRGWGVEMTRTAIVITALLALGCMGTSQPKLAPATISPARLVASLTSAASAVRSAVNGVYERELDEADISGNPEHIRRVALEWEAWTDALDTLRGCNARAIQAIEQGVSDAVSAGVSCGLSVVRGLLNRDLFRLLESDRVYVLIALSAVEQYLVQISVVAPSINRPMATEPPDDGRLLVPAVPRRRGGTHE